MGFKELSNHLLDLGKRNRLLNYKEKGYRGISILNKNLNQIYKGIIDSKEYKILPVEPILARQRNLTIDETSETISYSKSKAYDIVSPILKNNELLCYKEGYPQARVLKSLYKEYQFSINEKGINSLYVAFGFLKYKEAKNEYIAPLLLIPLLYNKLNSGYSIKEREDEVILNPTLSYYLKEGFKIKLPTIIDEDEPLDSYLNRVKEIIPTDMEILNRAEIGIFSFAKMNMYDDLANNSETVLKNDNIKALVNKKAIPFTNPLPYKLYPVKDYDSSQLEAIKLAASGESFTLEGPPGSGKSQTITNIIATLIGNGRRVLFVSEKLAALEVVYNNLRKVGLSDFALEIHSSKANKKDVISEIYRTATLPHYMTKPTSENDIMLYDSYKGYLDEYNRVLHKNIKNENVSLYDLIDEYLAIKEGSIDYRIIDINAINNETSLKIIEALREYSKAIEPIGYSYKDSIFSIFISLSYEYISYDFDKDLDKALKYTHKLMDLITSLNKYIRVDNKELVSINDLYKSIDFIDKINRLRLKSSAYLDKSKRAKLIANINEANRIKASMPNIASYDKKVLDLDLETRYRYINGSKSSFSRLFDKQYKEYKRELLGYRNDKCSHEELIADLKSLIDYKEKLVALKKALAGVKAIIGSIDIAIINNDLELTKDFIGYSVDFSNTNILTDTLISFKSYYSEDLALNKLAKNIDSNIFNVYDGNIELVFSKIKELYLKRADIKAYYLVYEAVNKLRGLNSIGFLDAYLNKGLSLSTIGEVYRATYLKNRILEIFSKDAIFKGFNHEQFDLKVAEFIKLDVKMLELNRDLIIAKNSEKRPDDVIKGGAFSILQREEAKLKRKMPIRRLIEEIGDFIFDIKPVLLMSPLSVSTYLSSKENIFDAVVFDEASQIFAWDALGAIYRSKQCIIIGDSKQMPPSSFFQSGGALEDDEYSDDDIYDMESILDMAQVSFRQAALSWHYRSRAEELIEFSNNHFYDNRLITIPEADSKKEGLGIDLMYLENGIYDMKTRTNRVEAEAIADLVIEHLSSSDKSLGVVAFSQVQAELIEDIIEERILNNPELSKYFREDIEEPFFVKNLETVQGDERDRIIFSICYGYNSDHKFYQRFGPLNNLGGERRLNVAITRAKYNITVVSSIRYTDIRPTEALGCRLLYEYLKFAENVKVRENYKPSDSGIINSVKSFLEENNYEVYTNYGASAFKIPLAVKKPGSDKFLLAIICDSKGFTALNTSDRDRLLRNLIIRQGFGYYRIYAPSWFNYSELERTMLLNYLASLEDNKEVAPKVNDEVGASYLEVDNDTTSLENEFIKYKYASNEELFKTMSLSGADIMLRRLIEEEAPITKAYLYKRVSEVLGKKSVTNTTRAIVDKMLPPGIKVVGDTYFNAYMDIAPLRIESNRQIDEIPNCELMDGILKIVAEASIISKHDCFKKLSQILGLKRLTEKASRKLEDSLVFLALDGKIAVNGDKLCV